MQPSHVEAERRYDELRKLAIEYAQNEAPTDLKRGTISPKALSET